MPRNIEKGGKGWSSESEEVANYFHRRRIRRAFRHKNTYFNRLNGVKQQKRNKIRSQEGEVFKPG